MITDELRKLAANLDAAAAMDSEHGFSPVALRLNRIADNIDAAHERALAEQHESLTVGMKPMADESMAEHGWVRLPKDADGETIHLGDELEYKYGRFVVSDLTFYVNDGWEGILWSTDDPINEEWVGLSGQVGATPVHHAKPESWERIIADALRGADRYGAPDTYPELVAELVERCKRLAGEDA